MTRRPERAGRQPRPRRHGQRPAARPEQDLHGRDPRLHPQAGRRLHDVHRSAGARRARGRQPDLDRARELRDRQTARSRRPSKAASPFAERFAMRMNRRTFLRSTAAAGAEPRCGRIRCRCAARAGRHGSARQRRRRRRARRGTRRDPRTQADDRRHVKPITSEERAARIEKAQPADGGESRSTP